MKLDLTELILNEESHLKIKQNINSRLDVKSSNLSGYYIDNNKIQIIFK